MALPPPSPDLASFTPFNELDLRPLSVGELLDRAVGIYRRHIWLFIGIIVVPNLVAFAAAMVYGVMMNRLQGAATSGGDPSALVATALGGMMIFLVLMAAYLVLFSYAQAATIAAVSDLYLGKRTTVGTVYRRVRRIFWRILGLAFVIGFSVGVALVVALFISGIVGGLMGAALSAVAGPLGVLVMFVVMFAGVIAVLFVAATLMAAIPAAVLENATFGKAIDRSLRLTRKNLARGVLVVLFNFVISMMAILNFQYSILIPLFIIYGTQRLPLWLLTISQVSGFVATSFVGPVSAICVCLYYFDLRIRKEGFDLEILLARMNRPATAPAVETPAS